MIDDHFPSEGPTPENMVSYSERLLNYSIERLTLLLVSQEEITPAAGRELADEFRSLRKALEIAYHERANLQKLKGAEGGGGACLDLAAARDEVQRRLARLRAARGGDGVPRQSE
ncbi:MAG: hypothetical protein EA407_04725 [Rhodobacteraceae bacterium]|nr:MAG: hypothetical protein EA407_04725 [Paracoccaceae bacterium]